jgi:hypothetical protein
MATLILSTAGSQIGGPIGAALGALIGQQLDQAIFGSGKREGPRLRDLKFTTSSYGTPIARHHGRLRAGGSLIWATDLSEASETGGGKGKPSTTSYSYSASFAVALSSRPIQDIGRIWADGNLLRGEAGDLKVGGTLRVYSGHGDQAPDPLIASDRGEDCPAFRHIAYAVFEDLELADYGNRMPALTFEVIADDGEVTLAELVAPLGEPVETERGLAGLEGFTLEGGPLADTLAGIDSLYPLVLDTAGDGLAIGAGDEVPAEPAMLPPPAATPDDDSFGREDGRLLTRLAGAAALPDELRYYDLERDFQPGLQRADGRARQGRSRTVEFPGSFAAETARGLINAAAERAGWARETLAWRIAELDPALGPGSIVRVPDCAGNWLVESWEWRDQGVELELRRLPRGPARQPAADAGTVLSQPDLPSAPTLLEAFELPWDGTGSGDAPAIYAAASSTGAGWSGAALYADRGTGGLIPLGGSGSRRSTIGQTVGPVAPSPALLIDRQAAIEVQLAAPDFALASTTPEGLAGGANRALVGGEVLQFLTATALGDGLWRLTGLLRGRGGTEAAALAGHLSGTGFVLLDGAPVALDPAKAGPSAGTAIVALGRGDAGPVSDPIANPGITLRPLTPVHPAAVRNADGSLALGWTRRARGAWGWPDEVELPLGEQLEAYRVGLGPAEAPLLLWDVTGPSLALDSATVSALEFDHPGADLWVRQVGSHAQSDPLLLATLS